MNPIHQSVLSPHLQLDEELLWTGQPIKGIVFRTADIFLIPFSLVWCGFAIFWVIGAAKHSGLFALFGVPFVLIGLMFVFGRFIIDAKLRANTVYGITEERILIKTGLFSQTFTSLKIGSLSALELKERNDGVGSIILGPKNPRVVGNAGMNWLPGMNAPPTFELIPQVRAVQDRILEIQRGKA